MAAVARPVAAGDVRPIPVVGGSAPTEEGVLHLIVANADWGAAYL